MQFPHTVLLMAMMLILWNLECIEVTLSVVKVDGHEVVQGIRASCLIEHHLLQHLCTSIAHSYAV